jgi:hypothetical protein
MMSQSFDLVVDTALPHSTEHLDSKSAGHLQLSTTSEKQQAVSLLTGKKAYNIIDD